MTYVLVMSFMILATAIRHVNKHTLSFFLSLMFTSIEVILIITGPSFHQKEASSQKLKVFAHYMGLLRNGVNISAFPRNVDQFQELMP